MKSGTKVLGLGLALGTSLCLATNLPGQAPTRGDRDRLPRPVYRVAENNKAEQSPAEEAAARVANEPAAKPADAQNEHPLAPALVIAKSALQNIDTNIRDYSCTMVKQERVGGKLGDKEYMFLKVRQKPFSVYIYFLGPDKVKGQEVIFYPDKNKGQMQAHGVGLKKALGMVTLDPHGMVAMAGQRYPITEIGLQNLTTRLIERAEDDMKYGECEVKFFKGAKINGRVCTCIQVMHPVPRKNFLFHKALVFVDDELQIPVRYEAYEWPTSAGEKPPLLEEYTYLNVKLNNGFTEADFDDKNPNYKFH